MPERQTSRILLLQEAMSCWEQQSRSILAVVMASLEGSEVPSSHWPVEGEALLSILLQNPLGSCSFRSKKPPFWSAAPARSNFEPEIPPKSTPELGELSSKQTSSQRDLNPDICPGKRQHDRCSMDFLIALSYIFEPHISFPCWDLHWKLGCEEAAAAWDCTDAWQSPQLQGKDAKTRRNCRHCTTGTCDVPFLCFHTAVVGLSGAPKEPPSPANTLLFCLSIGKTQQCFYSATSSCSQKKIQANFDMSPTKEVILTTLGTLQATFIFAQV